MMSSRTLGHWSLISALVLALGGCHRGTGRTAPPDAAIAPTPTMTIAPAAPAGPAPALAGAPDVASLVARVRPAIVNITTTQELKLPRAPLFPGWPFGDLFGSVPLSRYDSRDDQRRLERRALGSGFIVDPRGYVVTNAHVVDNADRVRVRLADERELDAKVKGRDERLDLAVLEIEPKTKDATKSDGMFGVELGNSADGVVVRDVRPGSPAEGALETGDVILEVGRKPVKSADDAAKAFRSTRRSDALLLRVKRNGVSRFVVLEARSVLGRREPDE